MVISPDAWLIGDDGVYRWSPERIREAWERAFQALETALRDPANERLVLLVGLPGAGKSTWLASHDRGGVIHFDATLCAASERKPLIAIARRAGRPVEAVWFDTPVLPCRQRNAARPPDRRVPDETIDRMAAALAATPPQVEEGISRVDVVRFVAEAGP